MILNIRNSRGRVKLIKFPFAIKTIEPSIEQIVEENKAEFIDIVISLISTRNSEEVINELNQQINLLSQSNENIPKNIIKKMYFTTFVMK